MQNLNCFLNALCVSELNIGIAQRLTSELVTDDSHSVYLATILEMLFQVRWFCGVVNILDIHASLVNIILIAFLSCLVLSIFFFLLWPIWLRIWSSAVVTRWLLLGRILSWLNLISHF